MKKTIISCLCSVFAVSLIGGVTLFDNSVSVSAEETMTAPSFIMENGAAVCKDGGGLRFSANLDIDTYNKIKDNEEVKFGMIIVPADSIYVDATTLEYADSSVYAKTGYELTVENIWGAMPKFSVEPTVSQKQIIDEEATLENNNLVVGSEAVTLYGAIENFHEQNYVRSFVGRAYYYTEESGYVFADYYDDTANDNEAPIENNTRCMYYVAQLAIEKGDDLATSVQTTYIDGFEQYLTDNNKSGRYRYFVDTYIDDVLASTESAYAKINSNVSVTPEDKDGYAVNQVRSKLAGTVYAAGKQRLVIRYESAPEAEIETATEEKLATINAEEIKIYGTTEEVVLETAYTFSVTETAEEAEASAYANWIADYYVTVDRAIGENELGLAGSYANWDNGNWVAFYAPATEANVATPLLGSVGGEWTYAELVKEVGTFDCGAFDANNVLGGMTMTVELRLTNPYDETDYIVVNKTEHTFAVPPEAEIEVATEEELAQINAEEIKIYGTTEEVVLETAYTFSVTETAEEAEASAYANWIADYYVTVDRAIGENELGLAGSYANWDNGNWVAFYAPATEANVATPLLGSVGGEWTYAELVKEVGTFDCGAFDANNVLGGMTMTVELRLTNPYDETDYIVINKTEHTFAVPPTASIETLEELPEVTPDGGETVTLETGYTFSTMDGAEDAAENYYAKWNADYVVSFDKAIKANTIGLAGSYASWEDGAWIAFLIDRDMSVGEGFQILASANVTVNYTELCTNVISFDCGAYNLASENIGTTMTVELRLINPNDASDYIVVNSTSYTFVKTAGAPTATIETATEEKLAAINAETIEIYGEAGTDVTLETAYTFSTTEVSETASASVYANWNADYVVSFDKAVNANTVCLAGSYDSWDNGKWIAFMIGSDLAAGENFQLLASANVTVNYTELCTNVISFDCGASNLASENIGTTMTVELRLINPNDATDYIVINSTSYTFE